MIYTILEEFKEKTLTDKRLIALDLGEAKIGVAISDILKTIATPYGIYQRRNMSKDLGHINKMAMDEEACGFVIGLPLQMDGTEGERCIATRHFANKLVKKTGLPVFLQDERMSTAAVTRALQESDFTRKKRQSLDDKLAAAYILQIVLDRFC